MAKWSITVAASVAMQPSLWPTAIAQAGVLAPRQWWKKPPHLPLPEPSYMRFRSITAYGGDGSQLPSPHDVISWLRWSREWHQIEGSR